MPGPLLYKAAPKWQLVAAFGGALAVHFIAVGIAALKPEEPVADVMPDLEQIAEVTFEQQPAPPEPTPPPEEEPEPVDAPPPPIDPPEFVEEKPTPPPKPKTDKPKPVAPIARPQAPAGPPAGPMSMSSAKAVAISSPRPEYPYEARRVRATGSGVCVMTVDPSGAVTSAEMAVSTGNSALDNAATSAFRRWRFKPGSVSRVRTPITFTMTGAQF
jgi:protein TonB